MLWLKPLHYNHFTMCFGFIKSWSKHKAHYMSGNNIIFSHWENKTIHQFCCHYKFSIDVAEKFVWALSQSCWEKVVRITFHVKCHKCLSPKYYDIERNYSWKLQVQFVNDKQNYTFGKYSHSKLPILNSRELSSASLPCSYPLQS